MIVTRRGFLTGMLALGAAPAIVRAASMMKVVTPAGIVHAASADRYIQMAGSNGGNPTIGTHLANKYVIFAHPDYEEALRDVMRDGNLTVIYTREIVRYG